MPYEVILDPRAAVGTMNVLEDQLPFATAKALNELATTFQDAERAGLQQRMTIRRPWVLLGVKIDRGDFATKSKLSARVHVDDGRSFLDKFEAGGVRSPLSGHALSVPEMARPSQQSLIPNSLRPKALDFQHASALGYRDTKSKRGVHAKDVGMIRSSHLRSRLTSGALTVLEGDKRTILIQSPSGAGVILQRVNAAKARVGTVRGGAFRGNAFMVKGRDPGLIVLYSLRPRTSVPASLRFQETAKATLPKWPEIFKKWYAQAVATARRS